VVNLRRAAVGLGVVLVVVSSPVLMAGDDVIDVDLWHAELSEAMGPEPPEPEQRVSLGLYPEIGVAVGPPNWYAGQGNVYLSFSNGRTFSIFGGYGHEWGPQAEAQIITVGWGGVRPIPVASHQLGFHGKFIRYRRWDDDDHGVHHGLSIGTMHGVGICALSFEMGAARSEQNHWMFTLEVSLKFAVPVYIPLTRDRPERTNSGP
jgi:hypothetical protein